MAGVTARPLTGRISDSPNTLLRDEVLDPQFTYEINNLLRGYVAVEKVLVAEYVRMKILTPAEGTTVTALLDEVTAPALTASAAVNMSDVAFTLERYVEDRLPAPIPAWHVDRSRNDLQACAQLLFGREQLRALADALLALGRSAHRLAGETRSMPMPGYTHFQAAQVITPGFYLAAVSEQILHASQRLLTTYDGIDACPLGSGAMSGQELDWDRDRMADLLGFARPEPVALTGVASRGWVVEITAELSVLGVALSRFATDLLTWGSSQYGFIDLPDDLCGISSAMPQKKNFPILERVRGRTAHLTAFHLDVVLGQRNTPFANLVEVSKEAGTHLLTGFTAARSAVRMLTEVFDRLSFREDVMAAVCEREFFGGFSLANTLTMESGVPWRLAQVIAGQYIVAAMAAGLAPSQIDAGLLRRIAADNGVEAHDAETALRRAFDVRANLDALTSAGSANPAAVRQVLDDQTREFERLESAWAHRCPRGGADPIGRLSQGTER